MTHPIPSGSSILRNLDEAKRDNRQDRIGQIADGIRSARDTAECWGPDLDDEHNGRLISEIQVNLHNALQLAERLR